LPDPADIFDPAGNQKRKTQKTKQTAGEQFVLFKRGIGIRD